MFKLANQVLDAYDDVDKGLLKKLAAVSPKTHIMSHEELGKLADEDFALSIITKKASKLNKFPIDTVDNTWLSNYYFAENFEKMPKIAAETAAFHIKQACERFGIKPTKAVVGMSKEASTNLYVESETLQPKSVEKVADLTKFAQVEQIGDNYTFAQYAFATPSLLKLACDYFSEHAGKIPLEWRHKYAAAIQKRSSELGLGQQKGTIAKYASSYYSAHVDAHLRARSSLLETAEPKFRDALTKMASMKETLTPEEFARLLHGFDKRAGLCKYYNGGLTDPYVSTFAAEAPTVKQMFKVGSTQMSEDEIKKVAEVKYDKIKEYFGAGVADELKKHGSQIFDSLPNDVKEVIASIANGTL